VWHFLQHALFLMVVRDSLPTERDLNVGNRLLTRRNGNCKFRLRSTRIKVMRADWFAGTRLRSNAWGDDSVILRTAVSAHWTAHPATVLRALLKKDLMLFEIPLGHKSSRHRQKSAAIAEGKLPLAP
jgi:hypothetical protein